jgi:hypothetical protein
MLDAVVEARILEEPLMAPIKEMIPQLGESFTTTDVYRRLEFSGLVPRGLSTNVVSRIDFSLTRLGFAQVRDSSQGIILWRVNGGILGLDDLI